MKRKQMDECDVRQEMMSGVCEVAREISKYYGADFPERPKYLEEGNPSQAS